MWGFSTLDSVFAITPRYFRTGSLVYYADAQYAYRQEPVHHYTAWVTIKTEDGNEKYGLLLEKQYVDTAGYLTHTEIEELVPPVYDAKIKMDDSFMGWGKIGEKWCLLRGGKPITAPRYNSFHRFSYGMAQVETDADSYGIRYVTDLGDEFETELPQPLVLKNTEQDAYVWVRGKYGFKYLYFSKNGCILYPDIYTRKLPFKHGTAGVYYNGRWGILDTSGRLIVPMQYASLASVEMPGVAYVAMNEEGERLYLSAVGDTIEKKSVYYYCYPMDTVNTIACSLGTPTTRYGIADIHQKLVLPMAYDSIGALDKQSCRTIWQQHRGGVCNAQGKVIIPVCHTEVRALYGKYLTCTADGTWSIRDPQGKTLLSRKTSYMDYVGHDLVAVVVQEKGRMVYKWMHLNGKDYSGVRYDRIEAMPAHPGYARIWRGNKVGLSYKGKEVIPPTYLRIDDIYNDQLWAESSSNQYTLFRLDGTRLLADAPYQKIISMPTDDGIAYMGKQPHSSGVKWFLLGADGQKLSDIAIDTLSMPKYGESWVKAELVPKGVCLINLHTGEWKQWKNHTYMKVHKSQSYVVGTIGHKIDSLYIVDCVDLRTGENLYSFQATDYSYPAPTNDYITTTQNNEVSIIDLRTKKKKEHYQEAVCYLSGRIHVKKGEKWGVLNKEGEQTADCKYKYIYIYDDAMWALKETGCDLLDTEGHLVKA
ncbi:MAG: WG repeat-containing protein, partial [Paludibacteraceae bacterium]